MRITHVGGPTALIVPTTLAWISDAGVLGMR